ncbi:MAG TPA: HAMP domain-containing sensor histidine kinase [Acidimicrobiales bacterium]
MVQLELVAGDQRPEADAGMRAEAAERRLLALTLMMAEAEHRLKNGLAVVAGWATLLADRWDKVSSEERHRAIEIIRRNSVGLTHEAEDVLRELRAEAATAALDRVVLDLAAVLEVTVGDWPPGPGHRLELVTDGAAPAWVDPGALQQIVGHLLENAVAYSPGGGRIRVHAYADGGRAVLEVCDQGIGVPDGIDIFAPFSRGTGSQVQAVRGSGIGLYVVRTLVEAMGGEVSARRHPDAGSTFTVRLPARRE